MQTLTRQLRNWYDSPAVTRLLWAGGITATTLVLYFLGVKFLLIPGLVVANVLLLPLPKIFSSIVSRVVAGSLVTAVLIQVAATFQFLLFPESGFRTIAVITWLLHIAVFLVAPFRTVNTRRVWFTRHDVFALIVAAMFIAPFAPMLVGRNAVTNIAKMGSVQAIDATNHYAGIAEMTDAEHLNYKPNYYYPKGFHIAVGFTQNTAFQKQYDLGWRGNAILFFAQYLVLGTLLAYMLYYLAIAFYRHLSPRQEAKWTGLWVALTLAPTAAVFYLIPMITEGFLNYYYVLATVVAGVIVLLGMYETLRNEELSALSKDASARWGVFLYLLLIFGASVSWPLLIPPLVVIPFLCMVPDNLNVKVFLQSVWHWRVLAVIAAFMLQLLPIYFQLHFASSDGSQGSINAVGGLKEFRPLVLLADVLLIGGLLLRTGVLRPFKRILAHVFIPLAAFIAILILAQYYSTGEVRYYAIKSAMLLEVLALALAASTLVYAFRQVRIASAKYLLLLPAVPFIIMVTLIGTSANPLKPLRDLFREHSGLGYAAFFNEDINHYVELGGEGKIKHFNSTALHYNPEQGKFYAHMQMPFWNNMMQYDSTQHDFDALMCVGNLYSNIAFGSFTQPEQDALVDKVKQCALAARHNGQEFYVLTDKDSSAQIRQTFGDLVKVVY